MGYGDEIMVTGEAVRLQQCDNRPVCVLDMHSKPRWHWLWDGNPRLTKSLKNAQVMVNYPGCRPYIRRKTRFRYFYTDYCVTPGELYTPRLSKRDQILIEPHIKSGASPNKQWGWERWQHLVELCPDIDWVQMGPRGTRLLRGTTLVETGSFREALIHLSAMRAAVLPEGGLHHACAALGIPAIVIFGAMLRPENTGYATHINLAVNDPSCVGFRNNHGGCRRAMMKITPEQVAEQLNMLS